MLIPPEKIADYIDFKGGTDTSDSQTRKAAEWLGNTEHGAELLRKALGNGKKRVGVRRLVEQRKEMAGQPMDFRQIRREIHELRKDAETLGYHKPEIILNTDNNPKDPNVYYRDSSHTIVLPIEYAELLGTNGEPVKGTVESDLAHELTHAGQNITSQLKFDFIEHFSKIEEEVFNQHLFSIYEDPEFQNASLEANKATMQAIIDGNIPFACKIQHDNIDQYFAPKIAALIGSLDSILKETEEKAGSNPKIARYIERVETPAIRSENTTLELQGLPTRMVDYIASSRPLRHSQLKANLQASIPQSYMVADNVIKKLSSLVAQMRRQGNPPNAHDLMEIVSKAETEAKSAFQNGTDDAIIGKWANIVGRASDTSQPLIIP